MRRLAVEQTAGSHSLAAAAHRERSADDARGRPFTVHFPVAAFPIGRKIRMLEGTIRRWPHAGSHGQHVLPYDGRCPTVLARIIRRAVKRCSALAGAGPAWGNCRFAPVATETAGRVTDLSKLSGHRSTMGGSASRRVATRVKPEQASKGKS